MGDVAAFMPQDKDGGPLAGYRVVVFDGTNHAAVVKALQLGVGDAVVAIPGRPFVVAADALQEVRDEACRKSK